MSAPFDTLLNPNDHRKSKKRRTIAIGVFILAIVGVVLSLWSASPLSGTGTLWAGVGLAAAGTTGAFCLGAAKYARILTAVCLAISLAGTLATEHRLDQQRHELSALIER